MRIDYLREFVEVAYCLSYSKAAKNLDTSQSSISKHVQLLEKHYDALLFERDTASISLTPFGVALVQEAITFLDAHNRFEARMAELKDLYKKSLTVGGMHYNPKIARLLREAQQDAESGKRTTPLEYKSSLIDPLITSLKYDTIDIAITLYDDLVANDSDLHTVKLLDDPLFALMKNSHPLASRESVCLSELSEWMFLKPSGSYFVLGNEALAKMFERNDIEPTARAVFIKDVQGFYSIDFENDITFIEGGVAGAITSGSDLISVPIIDEDAVFPIAAVCKASNERAVSFVDSLPKLVHRPSH